MDIDRSVKSKCCERITEDVIRMPPPGHKIMVWNKGESGCRNCASSAWKKSGIKVGQCNKCERLICGHCGARIKITVEPLDS